MAEDKHMGETYVHEKIQYINRVKGKTKNAIKIHNHIPYNKKQVRILTS